MQERVCHSCLKEVPPGNRFCAFCGDELVVPRPLETLFFEAGLVRREAHLEIRLAQGEKIGEHHLNSAEHICGRGDCDIPFDDPTVSLEHASFYYRDGGLYVRDLNSVNGVYIRLRERIPLAHGDRFMFGRQIFVLHRLPPRLSNYWVDGTRFSGSEAPPSAEFQITRVLRHGKAGEASFVQGGSLTIGRKGCDLNYPNDGYMSQYHGRLVHSHSNCFLEDANSTNGTYYRVREEVGLKDGDALVIGRQLIEVQID
jgi:pSer/pThr/pTyr-binding forkhead associated (FHA) protein